MDINTPWKDATFIGFDLETTGKYPLESQICEIGAVKWKAGEIVDRFQTLIKPDHLIPDEIIAIHNITNEQLENEPKIHEKISEFRDFIDDGIMVAHHAPFDMGFLAIEFENHHLKFPKNQVLCSSLLARKAITGVQNHRLQTLIKKFDIDGGSAHRAFDDAKACLDVSLIVFEKAAPGGCLKDLFEYQEFALNWSDYSMAYLRGHKVFGQIIKAIESQSEVQITYQGGSKPGVARSVKPIGLVRNARDDYLVAAPLDEGGHTKRYYLRKISAACL